MVHNNTIIVTFIEEIHLYYQKNIILKTFQIRKENNFALSEAIFYIEFTTMTKPVLIILVVRQRRTKYIRSTNQIYSIPESLINPQRANNFCGHPTLTTKPTSIIIYFLVCTNEQHAEPV